MPRSCRRRIGLRRQKPLLIKREETHGRLLRLSPLELSTRTGLDLDQLKAVVGQLHDRGYVQVGDQTITIEDTSALRELQQLPVFKDEVRHGLSCRWTDTPS